MASSEQEGSLQCVPLASAARVEDCSQTSSEGREEECHNLSGFLFDIKTKLHAFYDNFSVGSTLPASL